METNDKMEMRIREVAQQLFFKQGFALTSTTQIANEAGCTQALVHYYYRTKENLFRQIFLEQIEAALSVIARSLMTEDSFERFIENAISLYFDTLVKNPRLPYFVLEELVSNPERRRYLRDNFVEKPAFSIYYTQFETRLRMEQQAGRIADIEPFDLMMTITSLTVFTFIALPMYQDMLRKTDEEVSEFLDHRKQEVIRVILKTLKP